MASLHWLDDDIVLLIGRCLANAPTSLSAFAKTSCSIHTLFAAMLAELKCLNCVCRSAVGIASMAQLRSLGTLIFHDQPFAQHELSGLSLVLSTTCRKHGILRGWRNTVGIPHRVVWAKQTCRGPQFIDVYVKHRGVRFHRNRYFKQY